MISNLRHFMRAGVRRAAKGLWAGSLAWGAALIGLILSVSPAAADDRLSGRYDGVDDAVGWIMTLRAVEGEFEGLLLSPEGRETLFDAVDVGGAVEAIVAFADGDVFVRIDPRPIGVLMTWIPYSASGRGLRIEEKRRYAFLRNGVRLPETPEWITPPPSEVTAAYDPVLFLESYEFWPPEAAGRGYASLEPRYRTLIRLYAHVHTDVLWKLCQSSGTPPGLVEALEGQAIDCRTVLAEVARMQRSQAFSRYKRATAVDKAKLLAAVMCARTQLLAETCLRANQETARAAISMATAATILRAY